MTFQHSTKSPNSDDLAGAAQRPKLAARARGDTGNTRAETRASAGLTGWASTSTPLSTSTIRVGDDAGKPRHAGMNEAPARTAHARLNPRAARH
jgi:hypothetical protein